MERVRKLIKVGAVVLGVVVVVVLVGFFFMKSRANGLLERTMEAHKVDFPVPFPLSDQEAGALPADADRTKIATERAVERGKHLVEAFYACQECHGKDFAGGTMVDDPALGKFLGVNLTAGRGGQVGNYTVADWDRIVRHGIRPNGQPTVMPSIDFERMSDRELSDVIAYIRSMPPVDKEVPRPTYGPVGYILLATGKFLLSADRIDHQREHQKEPPAVQADANYGKHAVAVCIGCHRPDFTGGPIIGGAPDWPPAGNLTPHADGLKGWTFDDFKRAMREGKKKNGDLLKPPMDSMPAFAKNWSDTETQAVWAFLQTLPPTPTPR